MVVGKSQTSKPVGFNSLEVSKKIDPDDIEVTSERVDHLGIVAQFIDDIGIVDLVDSHLGYHDNEILTSGQVVGAMISMALGFVSRPMYLSPQFFESKALSLIIGKSKTGKADKILPEHLNDDKLGRVLDAIYDFGPDAFFQSIAFQAARHEKLTVPSAHVDTTTHSFYGEYENNNSGDSDSTINHAIITFGFSKDSRNDCKQLVQELLVSSDGDVPLMLKIHSGNESDVKIFRERVKELKQQFKDATDLMPKYIVADCKLYTNESIVEASKEGQPYWVTRVPNNVKEVSEVCDKAYLRKDSWCKFKANDKNDDSIYHQEFVVNKFDVEQRFIVVKSDAALRKAINITNNQIKKESAEITKQLNKLCKESFSVKEDIQNEIDKILNKCKFYKFVNTVVDTSVQFNKRGRPKKEDSGTTVYNLKSFNLVEPSKCVIEKEVHNKACFVIGSNDLLSDAAEIVRIYRKDQQGVERAFRFLKSNQYFGEAFFFKNEKRVVALLTIMTLSLLVYSLLQRKLRLAIKNSGKKIPNQVGKLVSNPTMNWVNQAFEGVDVVSYKTPNGIKYKFIRMLEFENRVLGLLGPQYVRRYSKEGFT